MERRVRAKNKQGKWIVGYYVVHDGPLYCCKEDKDAFDDTKYFVSYAGFADWGMPREQIEEEVDAATVCSMVPINNSVSLFEHDVVNINGYVYELLWNDETAGYTLVGVDGKCIDSLKGLKNPHILGNTVDSPNIMLDE